MPVWAIWVDDAFYFVTGTPARKRKNLAHNAHCVITVASSGLDVVVKGEDHRVDEEARLQRIAEVYTSQGWQTTVRNGVFYADFGAPSAGPLHMKSTQSPPRQFSLWAGMNPMGQRAFASHL